MSDIASALVKFSHPTSALFKELAKWRSVIYAGKPDWEQAEEGKWIFAEDVDEYGRLCYEMGKAAAIDAIDAALTELESSRE